ncbi:MmcQ/YjbR family DNA-binding protein [Nannocystis sp. ILAH1]|uniref:MmcQ/YjbR family DNA-binding protein n=1 Tax=Nannocystis sp. ILAH1 TaxID=2996789 RepID=UPI00226DB39E|nr:MmcQ/YjbR family DNA-binding protein [Nannocystis sp. ILAH1]MCY0990773.1 MmcQ/YjbR family DNA-binding protein [Nannocystis sp. ILAH1]
MTKQAVGAGAEQVRALALAYPQTVEEFPWGHTAVKVGGKAFLFMGGEGGTLTLSVKLPASHGAALLLPFASPTGYGLGKSGWVTASFPTGAPLPIGLLAEWLEESYRAVAPKKLSALVEPGGPKGMFKKTGANGPGRKGMAEGEGSERGAKARAKKAAAAPVPAKKAGAKKGATAKVPATAKKAGVKKGAAAKELIPAKKAGTKKGTTVKEPALAKAGAKKGATAKETVPAARAAKAGAGAKKAAAKQGAAKQAGAAKKAAKRRG